MSYELSQIKSISNFKVLKLYKAEALYAHKGKAGFSEKSARSQIWETFKINRVPDVVCLQSLLVGGFKFVSLNCLFRTENMSKRMRLVIRSI